MYDVYMYTQIVNSGRPLADGGAQLRPEKTHYVFDSPETLKFALQAGILPTIERRHRSLCSSQ